MDKDDKKDIAKFGFKRSGRARRPAVALIAVSVMVIIFAVWFVVIRH